VTNQITASSGQQCKELAYVEDNDADAMMIEMSVQKSNCVYDLTRYRSVAGFLDNLDAAGAGEAVRPEAVLLDINLPDGSGFDVLERVRQSYSPKELPIVVFSGGESNADLHRAYDLGANLYLNKPMEFPEYRRRIAGICGFLSRLTRSHEVE
jgi:DNA-binding response OmpR family regulator